MRSPAFFRRNTPNTQPADASIRMDNKSHARRRGKKQLFLEEVQSMCPERRAAQNLDASFGLELAALRKISLEVQRVDLDAPDLALSRKLDDAPVVMVALAAARFPSVVH